MKSKKFVLGLALASALLLTACGGGNNTPAPGAGSAACGRNHRRHRCESSAPITRTSTRPWALTAASTNFYRLIYRTLTTNSTEEGKAGEMKPDLATDLGTPSDGGKTWTFTLKDGIFFEDGTPITSAEVKFGVSRVFDPEIGIGSPVGQAVA